MKNCDGCGLSKPSISIGGAILCRTCAEEVRIEIDKRRAEGKQVNALGIARAMFRVEHSTGNYILRDVPLELWNQAKHRAVDEGITLRDIIMIALKAYLKSD